MWKIRVRAGFGYLVLLLIMVAVFAVFACTGYRRSRRPAWAAHQVASV